jgi:hypothetical protein
MGTIIALVIVAVAAGLLGSMLGVGGGIILVPVMSLFLGVPLKTAIATSLICVVVTSSASQVQYVGKGLTNTRLGMTLEIGTTLGALIGGLTAVYISNSILYGVFAGILVYVIISMERRPTRSVAADVAVEGRPATFIDPETGEVRRYGVRRYSIGLPASFVAGDLSALLGVGGGIIKVPIMNLVMKVPLRVSIATSNLMIGVTAATGAIVYYGHHLVSPRYAVPAALAVLVGAQAGPRVAGRLPVLVLRRLFQLLLVVFAVQMALKVVA